MKPYHVDVTYQNLDGTNLMYDSVGLCSYTRREILDALPEPIMVTGHTQPDADVISTSAALLNYFKSTGKQAYFSYRGSISSYLRWCISEEMVRKDDLESYKSYIVVDCDGSEPRIGFQPRDVPKVILDHHETSKELCDSQSFFFEDVPSTSALLPCLFGIYDPIIYVGLFYDSIALNKRLLESSKVLLALASRGLTDEVIAEFHQQMEIKKEVELIDAIRDSYVNAVQLPNGAMLGYVVSDGPVEYKHDLTAFYRQFFDGILLFMKRSRTFSVRLEEKLPFAANQFASLYEGGGGHKGAAGFTLPPSLSSNAVFGQLVSWIENQMR